MIQQDIFSYNVEQSRGDTHNMIVILMAYHSHNLQSAVDYVGDLCRQTIDAFIEEMGRVPSWDLETDSMVKRYVGGLRDWIVGYVFMFIREINTPDYLTSLARSLHWSFMTTRYFEADGQNVKDTRIVKLLPMET